MAFLYLTQLAIAAINIIFLILFVAAKTDFWGSVFETQVGKWLIQTIKKDLSKRQLKPVFLNLLITECQFCRELRLKRRWRKTTIA